MSSQMARAIYVKGEYVSATADPGGRFGFYPFKLIRLRRLLCLGMWGDIRGKGKSKS